MKTNEIMKFQRNNIRIGADRLDFHRTAHHRSTITNRREMEGRTFHAGPICMARLGGNLLDCI